MTDEKITILYVPCGSEDEAAQIARALLSERLIACGNIYPSRSLYIWDGKLADDTEYVLFAKTTAPLASVAAARIEELHSYQVPCILTISPGVTNGGYARWVEDQVSAAREPAAQPTYNEG